MDSVKNYDAAISDPASFHGRTETLKRICDAPQRIHLLLGGRKAGKTSLLYRICSGLLDCHDWRKKFLPVYLPFRTDVPTNIADFLERLLLPVEAIAQRPDQNFPWASSGPDWPRQVFLGQSKSSPPIDWQEFERRLLASLAALVGKGFTGVLFLLDDCETFAREDWFLQDAGSRLEAMKQSPIYSERMGFVFTGYRYLRDLQQKAGSGLFTMAHLEWLEPLSRQEVGRLVGERVHPRGADERDCDDVFEYAGGHPFLTQHLVSDWIRNEKESVAAVAETCTAKLRPVLVRWWNGGNQVGGGYTETERQTYRALSGANALTPSDASDTTGCSEQDCRTALEALCGSCIVKRDGLGVYSLGARIFSECVLPGRVRPRAPRAPRATPPAHGVTPTAHAVTPSAQDVTPAAQGVTPPAQAKPSSSGDGANPSRFVISIHGIETRGTWQKELTGVMGHEFSHEPWDYGDFSVFQLLWPGQRKREVDRFRDEYHRMCMGRDAVPSVVAHSFGTYIVAKAMAKYPDIRFDQMIFCGSIVPRKFRWSRFDEQRFVRMLHDYGCLDIWAKLVEWGVSDAGDSGSRGFADKAGGRIVERRHSGFGHSSYFHRGNFAKSWIPFLKGGAPLPAVPDPNVGRNWKFRLFLLVVAGLVAGVVWLGVSQFMPQQIETWPRAIEPAVGS